MEGGMPRVNIYDISRHAGVSIATVSRVLNNSPHVSEETRRKVMKVIDGCGYVPNAFARGLGLNTMKTIGLLCPDAADPYLARALACLEHAALWCSVCNGCAVDHIEESLVGVGSFLATLEYCAVAALDAQ